MEIMAVCPSIFVSKIMQSNKENLDRDLSIVTTRTLGPQTRAKFLHSLFFSSNKLRKCPAAQIHYVNARRRVLLCFSLLLFLFGSVAPLPSPVLFRHAGSARA